MCPNEFKILANVKDILKNLANDFNFFCQSGEISPNLVTLPQIASFL